MDNVSSESYFSWGYMLFMQSIPLPSWADPCRTSVARGKKTKQGGNWIMETSEHLLDVSGDAGKLITHKLHQRSKCYCSHFDHSNCACRSILHNCTLHAWVKVRCIFIFINIYIQTAFKIWWLVSGQLASEKSIVLTLKLCHSAPHWQQPARFISLRLI